MDSTNIISYRQADGDIEAIDAITLETEFLSVLTGGETLFSSHWNGLPCGPTIYTYFHFETVCGIQRKWNN